MTVIAKIPVELNEYSVSVQILHTSNPIVICKKNRYHYSYWKRNLKSSICCHFMLQIV